MKDIWLLFMEGTEASCIKSYFGFPHPFVIILTSYITFVGGMASVSN